MEYDAVVLWAGTLIAFGVAGLPLASLLFRRLPDQGAGVVFPVSLAVVGLGGFWIGQAAFDWKAVWLPLGVLVVASALALREGVDIDMNRFTQATVVFLGAFGLLIAIRSVDPAVDPAGGEKFLDYGLLATLLRARQLPPEDMWFAGETVRYYYGGHMIGALLAKLTGTGPRLAYNLALAVFYATFVSTAYGLAGTVGASRGRSYVASGLFAAFFVGLASNLATVLRGVAYVGHGFGGKLLIDSTPVRAIGLAIQPKNFSYWSASRVIPGTINEFPFFAFLNGDLHAHMLSPPFLLLVAALLAAYWLTPEPARWERRLLIFGAVPLVGGLLVIINTWSVPTVLGLTVLTLAMAPADPWTLLPPLSQTGVRSRLRDALETRLHPQTLDALERVGPECARPVVGVTFAAASALLILLVAYPFVTGTASSRELKFLAEAQRSTPAGLLVVHGAFVLLSAVYLGQYATPKVRDVFIVGTVLLVLFVLGEQFGAASVALFGPVLIGAYLLGRTVEEPGFETVLIVGAPGLVLLAEFIYILDGFGTGPMNTVFKLYYQVWVLWGVAAGVILVDVTGVPQSVGSLARWLCARFHAEGTGSQPAQPANSRDLDSTLADGGSGAASVGRTELVQALSILAVILLVGSLSVYPALALSEHYEETPENRTLDSWAFLDDAHPGEVGAIECVNQLEGQPTIVSAPGFETYSWSNPASSLTGVPTVMGWAHEYGYRDDAVVSQRAEDVDTVYLGPQDERQAVLENYSVEYIYIGPNEQDRYPPLWIEGRKQYELVCESPDAKVFRVK